MIVRQTNSSQKGLRLISAPPAVKAILRGNKTLRFSQVFAHNLQKGKITILHQNLIIQQIIFIYGYEM